MFRSIQIGVILSCLFLLTGCIVENVEGETATYKFAWWTTVAAIVGGIAFAAIGYSRIGKSKSIVWSWGWFIPAFLCIAFGVPATLADFLIVDAQHMHLRTGLWFSPTEHDLKYADYKLVEHAAFNETGRRGRRNVVDYLLFHPRNGGEYVKVPMGTLMQEGAALVVMRAQQAGMSFEDTTQNPRD